MTVLVSTTRWQLEWEEGRKEGRCLVCVTTEVFVVNTWERIYGREKGEGNHYILALIEYI